MPSSVSGERRLRGIQPTGNLVVRAAFWICQGEGPVRGLDGLGVSGWGREGGRGLVGVEIGGNCASVWEVVGGEEAMGRRGLRLLFLRSLA